MVCLCFMQSVWRLVLCIAMGSDRETGVSIYVSHPWWLCFLDLLMPLNSKRFCPHSQHQQTTSTFPSKMPIQFILVHLWYSHHGTLTSTQQGVGCSCSAYIDLPEDDGTLQTLQSIIGTWNFACTAVVPGQIFLRHLINLIFINILITSSHSSFLRSTEFEEPVCWEGAPVFLQWKDDLPA